jgi:2'-5' RNA ligase
VIAMNTGAQIVTFWLCLAEPARAQCAALIQNLAARFDAPIFEPHVTIHVVSAGAENFGAILERVASGRGPYRLFVQGIEFAEAFTKTLFVQFAQNPELARLSEDLGRALPAQSDYKLNPHLSLLYKDLSTEIKRDLAHSIRLPFTELEFDSVKAVISPEKIESRADVEAWRVLAEHNLAR